MKIRQKKYPSGVLKWPADLGVVNGHRLQKYLPSREDAEIFARAFKSSLREDGIAGDALSPHDRVLFTTCMDRLAGAGATILEATNFYLTHQRPLLDAPDLFQIGREFLDEQRRVNSPKYVDDLQKPNLESFFRSSSGGNQADASLKSRCCRTHFGSGRSFKQNEQTAGD